MQWWVMLSISPGFHELSALFLLLHQWHQSNFPCHHVTIAPCRIGQQRAETHHCGINSVPWPKRCEALWGDVRCKIQRRFPNGFLSFLRQGIFALENLWGSSLPLGFSGNCHHPDDFLWGLQSAEGTVGRKKLRPNSATACDSTDRCLLKVLWVVNDGSIDWKLGGKWSTPCLENLDAVTHSHTQRHSV